MAKPKSAAKSKKPANKANGKRAAKQTKDEAVDVAVGSLLSGDNQPPTKDLVYHFGQILGLMEKAATAQSRVSDAKKKAKEAGVDVGALMLTMKLERLDPLDLSSLLRQQAALMASRGLPVQISLFEPKYGSVDAQAAAEGAAAGKASRSPDLKRWPEGSPGHGAMMRAWNSEQGAKAMKFGKPPQEEPDFSEVDEG